MKSAQVKTRFAALLTMLRGACAELEYLHAGADAKCCFGKNPIYPQMEIWCIRKMISSDHGAPSSLGYVILQPNVIYNVAET